MAAAEQTILRMQHHESGTDSTYTLRILFHGELHMYVQYGVHYLKLQLTAPSIPYSVLSVTVHVTTKPDYSLLMQGIYLLRSSI